MTTKRRPAARGKRAPRFPSYRPWQRRGGTKKARVTVGGRDYFLGDWNSPESWERYHRLQALWAANGYRMPPDADLAGHHGNVDDGPTVQDVAVAYLAKEAGAYLSKSEAGLCRIAGQQAIDLYGTHPATRFGIDELRVVRTAFVNRGLARKTVNAYVARVRRAFEWAISEGMIREADMPDLRRLRPLKQGRTPATDNAPREAVDWKTVAAALPHMPSPVRAIVEVLWHTAGRVGEVVQLRTRDIDMSGTLWVFKPPSHKSAHRAKSREILLDPTIQEIVKPFVQLDPDRYWFRPIDADAEHRAQRAENRKTPPYPSHMRRNEEKRKENPVVHPGERYDSKVVAHSVRKACNAAGVSFSCHQIRHAAIGRVYKEEGREQAQLIAGHHSEVVNRIYTVAAERDARQRLVQRMYKRRQRKANGKATSEPGTRQSGSSA